MRAGVTRANGTAAMTAGGRCRAASTWPASSWTGAPWSAAASSFGSVRGQIPGFGPRGRALAPGGRLMVREPDGRLHALLAPGALFDASDPSVSWDGRRIVFAAVPAPGRDWRLYTVEADGRGLRALTA